ncbi:hypothetical protein N7G274_008946 [Stereocaulon virgatum]|uniref:Uncharacterized protein n=1 Tax=Stereocaulon virgatum TaxID=373712 RepID=A0ABR4A1R6_9LECA
MSSLPLSTSPPHQSSRPSPQPPSPIPNNHTSTPIAGTNNDTQDDPTPTPQPANFAPYFTLLTNPTSSTTHHPTVQYIFSDDTPDTDPITAAALQVLDHRSYSSTATSTLLPIPEQGRAHERFVLIDMDATGTKVLAAQSMSPDWAVTGTELGPAPTWDRDGQGKVEEGGEEGEEGERGLMLRIEGMEVLGDVGGEVEGKEKGKGKVGEGGDEEEKRLEELVDVYERRMGELKRVVDAGAGVGTEVRRGA